MQQGTSFLKRFIALALALVLLVSNANLGVALQAFAAEDASKTVGQIMAKNYDLTENEAHLLEHGYIVGTETVVNYSIPEDTDNLIAVGPDNKKISVTTPAGWTVEKVEIVVGNEVKETVQMNSGVGSYTYAGNAFSVKAYYSLSKTIAGQEEIFAAIESLKDDLKNVDDINSLINTEVDGQKPLDVVTNAIPVLEMLAAGIDFGFMTVQFGEEAIAAVGELEALIAGVKDLNAAYLASASKVQHVLEKAADYQSVITELHTAMAAIQADEFTSNSTVQGYLDNSEPELAEAWEAFTSNLDTLVDGLGRASGSNDWTSVGKNIVNANVNYVELDSLIYGLPETLTAVSDDKSLVIVEEAAVQHKMSMFDVTVNVILNVVENKADSDKLVEFDTKTVVLTLAENATKDEILAEIEDSGIVASATDEWRTKGAYVDGEFTAEISELPAFLTKDITYTVEYTPKNYDVTLVYDNNKVLTVPYGYKLTLPANTDETKAYDYFVNGVYYAQGEVVTVVENTEITREAGKNYQSTTLYGLVADNYGDAIAKAILKSGALLGDEAINYRKPDPADAENLLKLEAKVLTAENYPSSYKNFEWVPYTYGALGTENEFAGNSANWNAKEALVQYKLSLTNFSAAKVAEILELAADLKKEADANKSTLDGFAGNYDTLTQLDKTKLGALNGVIGVTDFTPDDGVDTDAKNLKLREQFSTAVNGIINGNLEGTSLRITKMLSQYVNGGLEYYYKNSGAFIAEINSLASYLNVFLSEEEALRIMVTAAGFPEYAEKIENIGDTLNTVQENLTNPNEKINLNSANLPALIDALSLVGESQVPAKVASPYILSEMLKAVGADQAYVQVKVITPVGEKAVQSESQDINTVVTKATVDALKAGVEAAVAELLGENVKYYNLTVSADLDALVGENLTKNVTITYTYDYKVYTVKIEGEADQKITLQNSYVTLPAPEAGYKYVYEFDAEKVEVEKEAVTKTFTTEQIDRLFKNGVYTIARTKVNLATEKFDNAFGDWVKKDSNGNVTELYAEVEASDLMGFAMTFVNSGYSYIDFDGEDFLYLNEKNELEIMMQTLINALLNDDGFSSERMIKLGKDGKGVFLTTKVSVSENPIDPVAKTRAVNPYENLDFTLYLKGVPSQMATVAKGLEAAKDYMSFNAGGGVMNINLNLPEKIYEVYLTALLAAGRVDKTNMEAVNSEIAFNFLWDHIEAIIESDATTTTFSNTLAKAGVNADLSGAEEYYQLVKDALTNPGVVINPEDENEDVDLNIKAKSQEAINDLINMIGIDVSAYDTYLKMIKEYKDPNAEISVAAKATLGNTNKDFQVAVIDVRAAQTTNKFDYAANGVERINSIAGEAFVILLDDLTGNLTIKDTTILDLNGFDVNGKITVNGGTLYIIDSTLNTNGAGKVTGTVSGNAKIFAGVYENQNVTSFLPEGYVQVDGAVANRLYTLETDKDLNTVVSISTDLLRNRDVDYFDFVKALAIDLGVDFVLNNYTSAALAIAKNQQTRSTEYYELYNLNFDDLIALLQSSTKATDLVQKLIDSISIGNFDTFINDIIADMLDFASIKAAAANEDVLFTRSMYTHPFNVDIYHQTKGDYIEFGIGADENVTKYFSISLKAALPEDNKYIAKIAGALDAIVDDATYVKVTIDEIENKYFETKGIEIPVITGGADVKIIMDLTVEDAKYAKLIAEAFGKTYSNAAKATVDAATAGEIIDKLEAYVDGTALDEAATAVLNTLTKALKKLGVEDKKFGGLETEYGVYVLEGKALGQNFRGVFEDIDVTVYIKIKLFDKAADDEHKHSYTAVVTDPTCTEQGYTTYTCSCGDSYVADYVPALGHVEVTDAAVAPTCTETGLTEGMHCEVCGEVLVAQEVVPALDHDYDAVTYEPTCSSQGYTHYTCKVCGHEYDGNLVDCLPHPVDENKDHACDNCGMTIDECYDNDGDHKCDWCGAVMGDHEDNDKDHFCDVCGERMSHCRDCNRDHYCDWCGALFTECVDRNHDHICDICWKVLSECVDKNKDHLCDYCLRIMSWCYDLDKDHFCDYCGREISKCIDTDRDGICDICGADLEWVIRLWGDNRAETARDAAEELKAILGVEKFDSIVYASGYNFPDALTGTYFANVMEAPILMYFHQEIAMNQKYIQENLAKNGTVYILGGTEAVPAIVETELVEAGIKVVRLGGETRFETNLEILDATGFDGGETVLVCTGYEFADSLSASATGLPILLVNNSFTELRESQVEYLENLDAECNYILIGGTNAISAELEAIIAEYDVDGKVERIGGATRFETSLMVAEKFFPKADQAILAYGWMFPDALCGGTIGYALGAPVILTSDVKIDLAADYIADRDINSGYVMGGTVRLSDEVVVIAFDLESADEIHLR